MCHSADSPGSQFFYRFVVNAAGIAAVDETGGFIVAGLKSQFYPQECLAVEFFQKIKDIIRQTVGAGGNGKSDDSGVGERFFIQPAQVGSGGIGIRMTCLLYTSPSPRD